MKESPLYPVGLPPANSMMQAHEVLAWIAFRRAVPFEQFACLFNGEPDIWSGSPQHVVLWALEARAGLSDDLNGRPCYAVCYPTREDPDCIPSGHSVLTRQGPRILRFLRALYRKNSGRLMTFSDVARLHREKLSEDNVTRMHLDAAKRVLRDKAAGGLLTAYGLPHGPKGEHLAGAMVQPLPETIFMHPAITFTEWNGIGSDPAFPHDEVLRLKLPRFESIQFKTSDVMRLWPSDAQQGSPNSKSSGGGRRNEVLDDIWAGTTGAWIPLKGILDRIKSDVTLDLKKAAVWVREGVEGMRIRTSIPNWGYVNGINFGCSPTEKLVQPSPSGYYATEIGVTQIDWKSGTLEDHEVRIFWPDVARHLKQSGFTEQKEEPVPNGLTVGGSPRGRPKQHDWEAFWIEVVIWVEGNGFEQGTRIALQKHMEDWTATQWQKPPDPSTIREKLKALFHRAAESGVAPASN